MANDQRLSLGSFRPMRAQPVHPHVCHCMYICTTYVPTILDERQDEPGRALRHVVYRICYYHRYYRNHSIVPWSSYSSLETKHQWGAGLNGSAAKPRDVQVQLQQETKGVSISDDINGI
jgi:hypothetical protein